MRIPTYRVAVARAQSLTPRMRRITLGGPALATFTSSGLPDERIKLLLAQPGQRRPQLPVIDEHGFHYPPGAQRPIMRSFTLRRFDHDTLELDVDVVVHAGIAADWSLRAQAGDEAAIAGPAGGYEADADARHYLLAGDESALPAIATILERLPKDARADVLVEITAAGCELALDAHAELRTTWLYRKDGVPAGAQLVEAVRAFDWPASSVNVWAAGEALSMRAIRRHLRDDLTLPRERYEVIGHWRERLTEDQTAEHSERAQQAAIAAGAGADEVEDAGLY